MRKLHFPMLPVVRSI